MKRVVVGMSGGVDSAVAAALLQREGRQVLGVFMRNWREEDAEGVCAAEEDYAYVRGVCDKLGIPYYGVDFSREYRERVFSYFLREYQAGRTPNPDVLCNNEIKFDAFLKFALELDADAVATGHYARLEEEGGKRKLLKGADTGKDQSYFLHGLRQSQLSRVLFPLGGMKKSRVREIAREMALPNAERKDSTGICFIGERNFREFLRGYLPAQPGDIVEAETGRVIGRHAGLMYYTLGQRKGLGIGGGGSGEPWFVVGKELESRRLLAAQGRDHPLLYSGSCALSRVSWIAGEPPRLPLECRAKFRYRQPDQEVRVLPEGEGVRVEFAKPQRAVTPGQYCVFYDGEVCLGGGQVD
ncbi:MAG: tRNA 2-thiouridine(34) synthase MnmA [Christensenellales bacterium]